MYRSFFRNSIGERELGALALSCALLLCLLHGPSRAVADEIDLDIRVKVRASIPGSEGGSTAEKIAGSELAIRALRADLVAAGATVQTSIPDVWLRSKAAESPDFDEALSPLVGWLRVRSALSNRADVLAALAENASIEAVEPALSSELCAVPDDPRLPNQATFLAQIDAFAAWDLVRGEAGNALIAVVDTGTEWRHPDLLENVWNNPGEIDGNGLDDDGNGFVDDVVGWNFPLDTPDPTGIETQSFNRTHGTHVAGIAAAVTNNGLGVTGVSWNSRLLSVNAAHPTIDRAVAYGYEGILYAALAGADVINCSWRRRGRELAFERSVVQAATALGSLVVAASGNDSAEDERIFPAAYPEVLAVAAVAGDPLERWSIANVGRWVDILAPGGSGIHSTAADSGYVSQFGTSMAAPVVAGAAALVKTVHPEWSALQIRQQLRETATDLDPFNPGLEGRLGGGLLQLGAAVSASVPGVHPTKLVVVDQDGDGIPEGGEILTFQLTVTNELAEATNLRVRLVTDDPYLVPLETTVPLNRIPPGASLEILRGITAWLSYGAPLGHVASIRFAIEAPDRTQEYELPTLVSPLHATVRGERIEMSVTSTGKLGFADIAGTADLGGVGLRRPGGRSAFFTGGLMIGDGSERVSDAIQAWSPNDAFEDYRPIQGGALVRPPESDGRDAIVSQYNDLVSSRRLGLQITQETMAYDDVDRGGFVLVHYRIRSQVEDLQAVRAGVLIDWDVGSREGPPDRLRVDETKRILWSETDPIDPTWGVAGVGVVAGPAGFTNGWMWQFGPQGREDGVSYLFDLEDLENKPSDALLWSLLSGDQPVSEASTGEVVGTLGVGPFDLAMGEETDLVLAFVVAENEEVLRHEIEQARLVWESRREGEGGNLPTKSRLLTSAPNPFNPRTAIRFALPVEERVRLDIYDLRGRHVRSLLDETRASGFHRVIWEGVDGDGSPVASGVYRVLLRTPTVKQSSAVTLVR